MAKTTKNQAPVLPLNIASLIIIGLLIALLIAEYLIAQFTTPRGLLLIFAVAQGAIVLWEYMHVKRAFGKDDSERD